MRPNTKMSYCHVGFDLKAAREALSRATERPNVATDIYHLAALTYLPAALDEIERQAKEITYWKQGAEQGQITHKKVAAVLGTHDALWVLAQETEDKCKTQAKRMAELEEENRQLVRQILTDDDKDRLITKQRAALKKLGQAKRDRGKALVEERARRICHVPGDPVGHWARYEPMVVDEAREQLRREGKL